MRRLVALGVLAMLLCIVLADRTADAAATGPTPVVAVIGDSLLSYDRADLDGSLRAVGWAGTQIDAVPSRRIPASVRAPLSGIKAIRALRATGFDTRYWIIALGTNDIGLLGAADPRPLITSLLDELGPGTTVLWVNADQPRFPQATARFDAALAAVLAERGGYVFDWASLARANPTWLVSDGIHLTGTGFRQRHRLLAQASRALLEGAVPAAAYQPVAGLAAAPSVVAPGAVRVRVPAALLRIGMQGKGVSGLQAFMRRQGWYPHRASGTYGLVTRLAVKRMQVVLAGNGFAPHHIDGIYDASTATALSAYLTSLLPPPAPPPTAALSPTTAEPPSETTTVADGSTSTALTGPVDGPTP
jgi:hypothetical protein